MTWQEKVNEARRLRAEGVIYADVAERLGVSLSTVYRWVNPERVRPYRNGRAVNPEQARKSDHRYSRKHRGTCQSCGGKMGIGRKQNGVCRSCIAKEADRRADLVVEWWAEGLSRREIAGRLDMTVNSFEVQKVRWREQGYDLPYRYSLSLPKHPKLRVGA